MKFKFVNGDQADKEIEFQLSEITIGRDDGNILRLQSKGVSRYHASLKRTSDRGWIICDQNSTNGVKVNGKAIAGEKIVFDGDEITIGEQRLQLLELNGGVSSVTFQPIFTTTASLPPGTSRETAAAAPGTAVTTDKAKKKGQELLQKLQLTQELFGNEGAGAASPQQKELRNKDAKSPAAQKKRLLFNLCFYAVLAVAVVAILSFFRGGKNNVSAAAPAAAPAAEEFTLRFEKIDYDNIRKTAYRLELLLENGRLRCTLDDVISQRHVVQDFPQAGEEYANELAMLRQQLERSGIMEKHTPPSVAPDRNASRRKLTIQIGRKLVNAEAAADSGIIEFERAGDEINQFLQKLGMQTLTLTREELENAALEHFNEAEYAHENYVGDLSRLRDAFKSYRAAISCYEQFTPPHPNLKRARQRLDEVNKLRKAKRNELQSEFARLGRLNDYEGMARVCRQLMELAGERSDVYREASRQLIRLRRQLNGRKR